MTDEQLKDDLVAATYRDLAGERSPAHLDDKILHMAASQAQHRRYARSVTWTRPLAWAATIALCLAITLELTRAPAPEEIVSAPAPTSAPLPEKREAADERSTASSEAQEPVSRVQDNRADHAVMAPAALKFRAKDADLLRQAAEVAMPVACPEDVRADPEIWLQCIEALEESGDRELAAQERKALIEVFPDFNLP